MTNRRQRLVELNVLFGLAILIALTSILATSLKPNTRSYAGLPSFEIPKLHPGTHAVIPRPLQGSVVSDRESILVYRKLDGAFRYWSVPSRNGKLLMPDAYEMWISIRECAEFGPTLVDGQADESKPFVCHDVDIDDYWAHEWQWNVEGKNIGRSRRHDLWPLQAIVEGNLFVIGSSQHQHR